jgi:hypothetical protein
VNQTHRARPCAALLALVTAALAFSGCFGGTNGPPPGHIRQFVLVQGTGYEFTRLPVPTGAGLLEFAALSPSGAYLTLSFADGTTQLLASNGTLIRNLVPITSNVSCAGSGAVFQFLREDLVLGGAGDCLVVMGLDGTVVWTLSSGLVVNIEDPMLSSDGSRGVSLYGQTVRAFEVNGARSAEDSLPEPNATEAKRAHVAISPDGSRLAVVLGITRFYAVDLASGTLHLLGEFPRIGRVLFSADSLRAVQGPDDAGVSGSDSIALYEFGGPAVRSTTYACPGSSPGLALPACPPAAGLQAISPSGRWISWSDLIDAIFEDSAGHGNWTTAGAVHLIDLSAPNATRGFEAGPPRTGAALLTDGPAPDETSVIALVVLEDGSAVAVSVAGTPPQSLFVTRASAGSSLPGLSGRYA